MASATAVKTPRLPFALDPLIAEAKRRARRRRYLVGLGLVAAVAIATGLTLGLRPGKPGRGAAASPPATYSGRLYSVADVQRAFAQLGLELHRDSKQAPGLVYLVNNLRLGPQLIPSTPGIVTVVVATRRAAVGSSTGLSGRATSYANVVAYHKRYFGGETAAAISALRWGTFQQVTPAPHRIALGNSIGPIRVGEAQRAVERAFGPGRTLQRGVVSYFGGRLIVNYWFHDGLYTWVQYVTTRSPGYHTTSGAHVGSSRQAIRALYASCFPGECWLQSGPTPDAAGTKFILRHGKVASIEVGSYG